MAAGVSLRSESAECHSRNSATPPNTLRGRWLWAVVVLGVFVCLCPAKLWLPGKLVGEAPNVQISEAKAWWNGSLDLPERRHDTAEFDGKVYSHFPLMFSLIAAVLWPVFQGIPHPVMVTIVLLVPLLAYRLFLRVTGSPSWGALLAIAYVCGTSAWPVLDRTLRTCSPYFVNITLANIGLLILLGELHGRRRVWVGGVGLIIATLSRQLTVAFAIPLFFMALNHKGTRHSRRRMCALAGVGVAVAAFPLAANTLKFGHPLRTGYELIYEGRTDSFAVDAQTHGVFSAKFVPRNLYYANLGFPKVQRITVAGQREVHLQPNTQCTGIWWTTPLLAWLIADLRRLLRDPELRWMLLASALVFLALMFFHATGAYQRGYNRFSLDYMVVLMALVGRRCFVGNRRWISVGMIAWSVFYFQWFIQPGTWKVPLWN